MNVNGTESFGALPLWLFSGYTLCPHGSACDGRWAQKSVVAVAARHCGLRLEQDRFLSRAGKPWRVVHDEAPAGVPQLDAVAACFLRVRSWLFTLRADPVASSAVRTAAAATTLLEHYPGDSPRPPS